MSVLSDELQSIPDGIGMLSLPLSSLTPVAVWSGTGRQGMTTLADCFRDWKDWFRDRDEIQARWDQRRMERATGKALGASGGRGRL